MKPIAKATDVERFNSWLDKATNKFIKTYEEKMKDIFGDSLAGQIMPKSNIQDLNDMIFYHSRIFRGQVVLK